jgi:hypothetical protein
MKIFILFFSLFLPIVGIKAQTIRDINTKDIPKYRIKIRPISIDPKLGTVRNPNEYLEDIDLDTIAAAVALNVSKSRDLDKPINYATQAALLLKADKSQVNNVDNTRDLNKPISNATQAAINYLIASNNTSLTSIANATTDKLNNKFDKTGGTITGNVGIGTPNPVEKLHIKWGNILMEANEPKILMKTPTSIINAMSLLDNKVFIGNGSGISVEIGGGANTMHVQGNNGNVGIGNGSPSKKLQVNGSIGFGPDGSRDLESELNSKVAQTDLSLKFDKAGGAITGDVAMGGNINYFGGAKIVVSPDGKSISIKPGGTAGAAIAKPPIDLYVAPAPIQEDSVRGYLYKGKQLFKQIFNNNNVTGTTVILSNIQDVYQLAGNITYTTANGNVVTYDLQSMVTTGLALLKYSIMAGTLSINPYNYPNCTNQNFNVIAKYTKR